MEIPNEQKSPFREIGANVSAVPIVIDQIDVTTDHGRQAVAKLRTLIKVKVLSAGKQAAAAPISRRR
jgi:hypothetical protein